MLQQAGAASSGTRVGLFKAVPLAAAVAGLAVVTMVQTNDAVAQANQVVAISNVATTPAADDAPTFYSDVLPILQKNCQICHVPAGGLGGMITPMSLRTYEEARPWAPMIAEAVRSGKMPPWSAHVMHKGAFIGERYLTEEEKQTLIDWAEQGAPAGEPSQSEGQAAGKDGDWWIGEPDLVVEFPHAIHIADEVHDWQPHFMVRVSEEDHPEPRWLKKAELDFGPHVHHAVSNYLGVVAPGRGPFTYPDGFSILMPTDPVVTFNMHYYKKPGPGTAIEDNTRGALEFYEQGEVVDYVVETEIPHYPREKLFIPAGHPNFPVEFTRYFAEDTYLLAMGPHAHYRGKSFQYELEYPDGRREVLLWIPNYDFNWQHMYQYEEPILMPGGSTLVATWWFDNSANNPNNPDPSIDIVYGAESFNEMANARIYYASAEKRGIVVGGEIPADVLQDAERSEDGLRKQFDEGGFLQESNTDPIPDTD